MLDVNVIREDPERIRQMLRDRNKDESVLDRFLAADERWRALTEEGNRLRKVRNEESLKISKMKGDEKSALIAEMKKVSARIGEIEQEMAATEEARQDAILNIPNIPHPSVPIGKDENDNVVVYEWGEKRVFDFKPLTHSEIADNLGIIDFDRGTKVAGSDAWRSGTSASSSWGTSSSSSSSAGASSGSSSTSSSGARMSSRTYTGWVSSSGAARLPVSK